MTVLTGDIRDIGLAPVSGYVVVQAIEKRASRGISDAVIIRQQHKYPLIDGKFETGELDPGTINVRIVSRDVTERLTFDLPERGTISLKQALQNTVEYSPAAVSEVVEKAREVEAARAYIAEVYATVPDFEEAAGRVFVAESKVAEYAAAAKQSATSADMSAEEAAGSMVASESARDESRSARDTSTDARDQILELVAKVQADRAATEEASATAVETTRAEVSAAIAKLVDSAPEHLDTLAEIASVIAEQGDAAAALTQTVASKAPLRHEHQIGEIRSLPGVLEGKAPSVHSHSISQIEQLQATLDGINDALAVRARGNFDFVVSSTPPPADAPTTQVTVVMEVPAP